MPLLSGTMLEAGALQYNNNKLRKIKANKAE